MKSSATNLILMFLLAIVCINAKWKMEANPGIVWNETEHKFGDIKQGEIVETHFVLTNTTKDTLVIENVQGSCGCIVSKWPKQTVVPNDTAEIFVKFDPKGKEGKQFKSLTVYTSMRAYYLGISANVQK
jgi:hypothetical protein